MEKSSFWKELSPIWWDEIKSWFGLGDCRQTVTTIIIPLGSILFLIMGGNFELAKEEISVRIATIIFGLFWLIVIVIISFVSANRKLHNKQSAQIKSLEKICVENPFEFILKGPVYTNKNNERACMYIMVHNTSKQDIEDCYLRAKTEKMNNLTKLAWSDENPSSNLKYSQITIKPDGFWRSDIIIAWLKVSNAVFCIHELEENDRIIFPGAYEITISASGKIQGSQIEHQEQFSLIYEGGNFFSTDKKGVKK